MPWPFCSACGTILEPPESDIVKCTYCSLTCKFSDINIPEIITKSIETTKPTWIHDIDQNGNATNSKENVQHAKIEEPCPKCNNPELFFYTMQLRSVDEGSTVFYECPKCTYKFSINN